MIKTADKIATLMGIMDSFTHCIESVTSINKNYYLNSLCNETLNNFSKKNFFNFSTNKKHFNYFDIATLSFNGGLAQSNSGSGICHALAHSSEKILNVKHSESISFFIAPVIKYLLIKNEKFKQGDYKLALEETFMKIDDILKNETMALDTGCTACVVFITKDKYYCANSGDSRAIVCQTGNRAFPLSEDHKPNNMIELTRI